MNILFLTTATLTNRKESAYLTTISLAKKLKALGHLVIIIASPARNLPDHELIDGVAVYRARSFSRSFSHIHAAKMLSSHYHFEVVHSFSAHPLFILTAFLVKTILGARLLVHSLKSYSRTGVDAPFYVFLNLAHKVTVPTHVFARKLHGVFMEKIFVVHSPIDTDRFKPRNRYQLKKKYGYTAHKIIFYYGALWKAKGVDVLIHAIPGVIQSYPDAFFVFAPRYAKVGKEKNLVQALGVKNRCQFVLHDIPVEEYVSLADTVVLPYLNLKGTEGNPSCMLESMASKTPVVTTDIEELREIADNSVFMARPGDVSGLVDAIKKALAGRGAVDKAYQLSKKFDTRHIAREFLQIYKSNTNP